MAKPDIKKIIQSQTNKSIPKPKENRAASGNESIMDSPLFAVAQGMIENMPTKYKLMIGGAIYLILAGVVGTGIGIVKLINLAF